jgi:hypothetical protein
VQRLAVDEEGRGPADPERAALRVLRPHRRPEATLIEVAAEPDHVEADVARGALELSAVEPRGRREQAVVEGPEPSLGGGGGGGLGRPRPVLRIEQAVAVHDADVARVEPLELGQGRGGPPAEAAQEVGVLDDSDQRIGRPSRRRALDRGRVGGARVEAGAAERRARDGHGQHGTEEQRTLRVARSRARHRRDDSKRDPSSGLVRGVLYPTRPRGARCE